MFDFGPEKNMKKYNQVSVNNVYVNWNQVLVTFQTHYYWPSAYKIEIIFCLIMCILIGKI